MGCIESMGNLEKQASCTSPFLVGGRIGKDRLSMLFNILFRQVFLVGSGVVFLQTDNIGVTIYKIRQLPGFSIFLLQIVETHYVVG